jgi:multidrug efflux system membrane fusion protein
MDTAPAAPEVETKQEDAALKRRRTFIGVAAVVGGAVLLALILNWIISSGVAAHGGRPSVTVGTAVATSGDLPLELNELGTVTPVQTVTVTPRVSGAITQVAFREGDVVQQGQLLAVIDSRPYQAALAQALGQQMRDAAQLQNSRVDLQRYQTLLAEDSIARQQVDTQAALVRQNEGVVDADRASVQAAELNVAYTRVVAPLTGRAGLREIDPGNNVTAGSTSGIVVITQVDPIDVVFTVPEDELPQVMQRQASGAVLAATVLDRSGANVLARGQLSTLDNVIDASTGTIRAKARFRNAGGALIANQFVNIQLLVDTLRNAVIVPAASVRQGPNGPFVWILGPGNRALMRNVTVGPAVGEQASISNGVQVGETVITEGGDDLRPGAQVSLPGHPASGHGGGRGGSRGGGRGGGGGQSGGQGGGQHHRGGGAQQP